MKKKQLLRRTFLSMARLMVITLCIPIISTIGWAETPTPYKLPKIIHWATADVGSGFYTIPAIIATKTSELLGSKIRLIPGNDVERIIMLRGGKAHLAMLAGDVFWASMGLVQYSTFALGPQPLRLMWVGWPDFSGSTGIATATSGIKTPYDLKGKKVVIVIGAAWSSEAIRGSLAFGKLTLNDVSVLEVSSTGAGNKAIVEGKADYHMAASNSPTNYEAESSPYGFYLVRFPHEDKEGWERYRKYMPYHVPGYTSLGPGVKPGEKVPTTMYPYPVIATLASQSDEFVYAMCKSMHNKMGEIAVAYPGLDGMRAERAIRPEAIVMAPFHEGAVKFFKEIGVWKEAHEAAQKKRSAHLEKVNRRWTIFAEEAQERMAKTQKKVDLEKEWREIVEKEIGLLPL